MVASTKNAGALVSGAPRGVPGRERRRVVAVRGFYASAGKRVAIGETVDLPAILAAEMLAANKVRLPDPTDDDAPAKGTGNVHK